MNPFVYDDQAVLKLAYFSCLHKATGKTSYLLEEENAVICYTYYYSEIVNN